MELERLGLKRTKTVYNKKRILGPLVLMGRKQVEKFLSYKYRTFFMGSKG